MSITGQLAKVRHSQGQDAGWRKVSSSQSDARVFRTGPVITFCEQLVGCRYFAASSLDTSPTRLVDCS